MKNPQNNQYNKLNQTVSCIINNEVICRMNVIVIKEEGADNCTLPNKNKTKSSDVVEAANAAMTDVSRLDCKLHIDSFKPKSSRDKEVRR